MPPLHAVRSTRETHRRAVIPVIQPLRVLAMDAFWIPPPISPRLSGRSITRNLQDVGILSLKAASDAHARPVDGP